MTVKFIIENPSNGRNAFVDRGGNLRVQTQSIPQNGHAQEQIPIRVFFENAGSNDLLVDGSVTPVDFTIDAVPDEDCYIKTLAFELTDVGNGDLNEFGNSGAALTNGVQICLLRDEGDVILHEGIKTNYQLVQAGGFVPAFGTTTNAFRASNVNGASEGWSSFIDLAKIYGLDHGIRIPRGTSITLAVRIRDNLSTGYTSFNCVATGFMRKDEAELQEE